MLCFDQVIRCNCILYIPFKYDLNQIGTVIITFITTHICICLLSHRLVLKNSNTA